MSYIYSAGGVSVILFTNIIIIQALCVLKSYIACGCNHVSLFTWTSTHVAEREYDTSYFHNQVQRVLIDDHNVPKFT